MGTHWSTVSKESVEEIGWRQGVAGSVNSDGSAWLCTNCGMLAACNGNRSVVATPYPILLIECKKGFRRNDTDSGTFAGPL